MSVGLWQSMAEVPMEMNLPSYFQVVFLTTHATDAVSTFHIRDHNVFIVPPESMVLEVKCEMHLLFSYSALHALIRVALVI